MIKPRFKDKALDTLYQSLVNNTPDQIRNRKIFGSILAAFTHGYNGTPKPKYIGRNTFTYAAYVASKESKK